MLYLVHFQKRRKTLVEKYLFRVKQEKKKKKKKSTDNKSNYD